MLKRIARTKLFYRIAESVVPLITWGIITLPIWLSPFRPAVASYFILAFMIYFFFKSAKTVYYAAVAYQLMEKSEKINWYRKLIKLKNYKKIHHYIVITNYKESLKKLIPTIDRLVTQNYPSDRINIVLAMEKREGEEAVKRSREITKKYAGAVEGFYTTYHQLLPGEAVGKASNEAYAARWIEDKILTDGIDKKDVVITICDADSVLPVNYLACVTFKYLQDRDSKYHFYWAPVLLYNNFWKLSLPIRVQSILSSIIRLSLLPQRDDLIQISTYSTNLWLLSSVGFWDPEYIGEDWHIWLQAFFRWGEKVRTQPVYLPVSSDGVRAKGLFKTYKNRYEQERRWAFGVSDVPYAIVRSLETPHINPILKLRKILFLIEKDVFWSTSFFILTLSAFIPALVNPTFARTVMGFILPRFSSLILTLSSLLLLVTLYFDHKMREKIKVKTRLRNIPLLFVQWYMLPLISFFFSSLPALEAHTRVLLGKKLEYKVTEKE